MTHQGATGMRVGIGIDTARYGHPASSRSMPWIF